VRELAATMCLRRYDYSWTLTADIFAHQDLSRPHQSRPVYIYIYVLRSLDIGNMRGKGRPCCHIGTQRCIFDRRSDRTDRSVTINYSALLRRDALSWRTGGILCRVNPRVKGRRVSAGGSQSDPGERISQRGCSCSATTKIIINFSLNVQIHLSSAFPSPSPLSLSLFVSLANEIIAFTSSRAPASYCSN